MCSGWLCIFFDYMGVITLLLRKEGGGGRNLLLIVVFARFWGIATRKATVNNYDATILFLHLRRQLIIKMRPSFSSMGWASELAPRAPRLSYLSTEPRHRCSRKPEQYRQEIRQ